MQQVDKVFIHKQLDYSQIYGDSGPLVYPAGFVWIFGLFRWLCGDDIRRGQLLFGAIYLVTQVVVMSIYSLAGIRDVMWPYILLALSRRSHSIYVLRMFNDGVTMLLFYTGLHLLMRKRFKSASLVYSLSVSVKMSTLITLPAILAIVYSRGLECLIQCLGIITMTQVIVAFPFLASHPLEYLQRAFDFKRQFLYKWTVNWRFVPQELFEDRRFGVGLLSAHALLLLAWAYRRFWSRLHWKNIWPALHFEFQPSEILTLVSEVNLVGIIYARSLHYQFYTWYFHTIPFMLYRARFPLPVAILIFLGIEWAWNVFPSTERSSFVLVALNNCMLVGLLARDFK